ncbi:MAG: hypothetical protein KC503_23145 [Myxococcales bacterium]|nr:hypothetical protein [Myxococcales bacterium]
MLRALSVALLATLVAAAGCAPRPVVRKPRVALLPLRAVGVPVTTRAAVRERIAREVRARGELVPSAHVDRAAASEPSCAAQKPAARARCAAEVCARTEARYAVLGALGRLGETHLVQLSLFDARSRALSRSLERTLEGRAEALAEATTPLLRDLLAPLAATTARRQAEADASGKPWYRRAWVWIVAGAVLAGAAAAITLPLILRDGSSGDPYENIPLP